MMQDCALRKGCLGPIFLLLGFFFLAQVCRAETASETYLDSADRFYQNAEYDKAISAYQNGILVGADNSRAYQGLSNCFLAKGDAPTAELWREKMGGQSSGHAEAISTAAQSFIATPLPTPVTSKFFSYEVGFDFGYIAAGLPGVDPNNVTQADDIRDGWQNVNETHSGSPGVTVFQDVYFKSEIDRVFTLGLGFRYFEMEQQTASTSGNYLTGGGTIYEWFSSEEVISGNVYEPYLIFGTPNFYLGASNKIFLSAEIGEMFASVSDSFTTNGYNTSDFSNSSFIDSTGSGIQYGLLLGDEWDFAKHISLNFSIGYQFSSPIPLIISSASSPKIQVGEIQRIDGGASDLSVDMGGLILNLGTGCIW